MQKRSLNFGLIVTLVIADAAMICLGWWLAYVLRIGSEFLPYYGQANFEQYRAVVLLSLPFWLAIFALCRLYDREELLGGPQEYGNVVKGCALGFAALIIVSIFSKTPDLARGWLLIGLALTTLLVGTARFGIRRIFYRLRKYGMYVQRALIVGTNDDARAIARQLSPPAKTGVQVVGFVDDFLPVGTPVGDVGRVVASTPNLHDVTNRERIDEVILVSGAMTWESSDQLLRSITVERGDTYGIKLSPGMYETLTTGVRVSYKNRVPLLAIERAPITGIDALLKGALDRVVGTLAFFLLLLPMGLLAAVLWLLGKRPPIWSHEVLGKNGVVFRTYHLQSISPANEAAAREWTRGRRLGRFLFESGLEKLPQLWNVALGQMSLVGPRPMWVNQTAIYQTWLPNLLSLKPGMTGMRASSQENMITLDQEMRLEVYYARNYSIWLDLQIMYQTLARMFHRERVMRKLEPEPEPEPRQAVRFSTRLNLPHQ